MYAVNANGRLIAAICTQTAPAVTMSATIRELRRLRDEGRSDDLFGNISIAPRDNNVEASFTARPFPNITVHATGKKGVRAVSVTDDQGRYVFASLPPDEYEIDEDLPSEFHKNGSRVVDLQYAQNGVGCRLNSVAQPDGKISGRVTGPGGAGVAGFITVEPSGPQEASEARQRGGLPGQVTQDGWFSLELIPPGTYRLIFRPKHGQFIDFRQTIIWPNSGSGLRLALGQHIYDVTFKVPATVSAADTGRPQ